MAALPDDGEAPPSALTAGQAARLWPGLPEDVAGHDARCPGAAPSLVRRRVAEEPAGFLVVPPRRPCFQIHLPAYPSVNEALDRLRRAAERGRIGAARGW